MSDLRTRIAAVLYRRFSTAMGFADAAWEDTEHETWLEDADAVIAVLRGIVFEGDTVESPEWGER